MPYIGNTTSDFSIDTGNITNRAVTATKLSPSSVGSNGQVLSVDGSGNLQWGNDANAPEGTAVLSTGESGTTKYLRVDGDGTCSWQLAVDATKATLTGSTNNTIVTVTGANAITGEANLTFDGITLLNNADTAALTLRDSSAYAATTGPQISFQGKDSNQATKAFGAIKGLSVSADNGELRFQTRKSGTLFDGLKIDQSGNFTFYNRASAWNTLQRATATDYIGLRIQDADASQRMQFGVAGGNNQIVNNAVQHDVVLKVYDANLLLATNATERFRITSAGNVGIGTTSPDEKFDVRDGDIILSSTNAGSAHRTSFIEFTGSYARINSVAGQGSTSASNYAAGWNFTTRNYTGSAFETLTSLTIQANGRVGIGTTSPDFNCEIEGTGGGTGVSLGITNTGSDPAGINLKSGHGNWSIYNSHSVGDALEFRDESASTVPMIINSSGNVGIGTSAPTFLLDIRKNATAVKAHIGASDGSLSTMPTSSEYGLAIAGGNLEFGLYKDASDNYQAILGTYQGTTDIPLVFRTASRVERLRIAKNGTITSTYPTVTVAQDTNVDEVSGNRFEITLPDNSRMFRIQGSFSFAGTGTYRIWGDFGDWSDSHTASLEGFANWWEEGAAGPTYQDVISGRYFEVADPVDQQCCEITYDIVVTTMAFFHGGSENQGGGRPGVSGTIRWTRQNEGNALSIFSYQDTSAKATDRLLKWTWDIDGVSGSLGAGKHHYIVQALPLTGDAQNLGDAA